MKSSIAPLSAVPQEKLIDYLVGRGGTAEVLRWKFFDEAFNQGRERGFVWWDGETVRGFIGLIPCRLSTPGGERPMAWVCEWSTQDPARSPGMGILMLKRVFAEVKFTFGVGGSTDTRSLAPRLATAYFPAAGAFFHLLLRLGGLLEKVEARFAFLPKLSRSPLGALRVRRPRAISGLTFQRGVAPGLEALFGQPVGAGCEVLYDRAFLEWQFERCPETESLSCVMLEKGEPTAGAIVWRHKDDRRHWRAALRTARGREDHLAALSGAVAAKASEEGGALLSTIVSHRDETAIASLRRLGFVEGSQRWPLYFRGEDSPCTDGVAQLSYLDADLGHRFR